MKNRGVLLLGLAAAVAVSAGALRGAQDDGPGRRGRPAYRVKAETVRVPVVVMDEDGRILAQLRKENFRLQEDGRPQEITSFLGGESPLTILLVLENSALSYYLRSEIFRPAGIFVSQVLGPEDYAAILAFDTQVRLVSDFTQNKQQLMNRVSSLYKRQTLMRESSLFDALEFSLRGGSLEDGEYKGLSEVEGRTALLLIATGRNTFSDLTFDEARRVVAGSGVPIYAIGVGERAFLQAEPYLGGLDRMDHLQAQSRMEAFSRESGGRYYSIRFQGAVNDVLESIAKMVRYEYLLGYIPESRPGEDRERKLEVQVDIDGDGLPDNERLLLQYRRRYYGPSD